MDGFPNDISTAGIGTTPEQLEEFLNEMQATTVDTLYSAPIEDLTLDETENGLGGVIQDGRAKALALSEQMDALDLDPLVELIDGTELVPDDDDDVRSVDTVVVVVEPTLDDTSVAPDETGTVIQETIAGTNESTDDTDDLLVVEVSNRMGVDPNASLEDTTAKDMLWLNSNTQNDEATTTTTTTMATADNIQTTTGGGSIGLLNDESMTVATATATATMEDTNHAVIDDTKENLPGVDDMVHLSL